MSQLSSQWQDVCSPMMVEKHKLEVIVLDVGGAQTFQKCHSHRFFDLLQGLRSHNHHFFDTYQEIQDNNSKLLHHNKKLDLDLESEPRAHLQAWTSLHQDLMEDSEMIQDQGTLQHEADVEALKPADKIHWKEVGLGRWKRQTLSSRTL